MKREATAEVLRKELQFVRKGGYRTPLVWRAPLVFEDSPTCPKSTLFCLPGYGLRANDPRSETTAGRGDPLSAYSSE